MKPLLFGLLIGIGYTNEIHYETYFSNEIIAAEEFIKSQQRTIKQSAQSLGHSERMCIAIVYPELLRYSAWKDLLETKAMEEGYTRWGSDRIDFSIGHFQMKASFAEYIETAVKENDSLMVKYARLYTYPSKHQSLIRSHRIKRLKSTSGQLYYLHAFYDVCLIKYPQLCKMNASDRVFALASIYNRGFQNNFNALIQHGKNKEFPYGSSYPGTQFSYGEIAKSYFNKIAK